MNIKNKEVVQNLLKQHDKLTEVMEFIESGGKGIDARPDYIRIQIANTNGHFSRAFDVDVYTYLGTDIIECICDEKRRIEEKLKEL